MYILLNLDESLEEKAMRLPREIAAYVFQGMGDLAVFTDATFYFQRFWGNPSIPLLNVPGVNVHVVGAELGTTGTKLIRQYIPSFRADRLTDYPASAVAPLVGSALTKNDEDLKLIHDSPFFLDIQEVSLFATFQRERPEVLHSCGLRTKEQSEHFFGYDIHYFYDFR